MGGADPRRQVVGTGEITQSTAEEEEGERYPPGRKLLQADDSRPPGRHSRLPRWHRRGPHRAFRSDTYGLANRSHCRRWMSVGSAALSAPLRSCTSGRHPRCHKSNRPTPSTCRRLGPLTFDSLFGCDGMIGHRYGMVPWLGVVKCKQ